MKSVKIRTYIYLLIAFVIFLLPQQISKYKLRHNFALTSATGESVGLVGERQGNEKLQQNGGQSDENTQVYQSTTGNGVIGRQDPHSDNLFLQIKKVYLTINNLLLILLNSVIRWIYHVHQWLHAQRASTGSLIMGYLPNSSMSLVTDMVFGQVYDLSKDQYHQLKITGMLHVVAASGFNISLVTIAVNKCTGRFGRFKELCIWCIAVGGYTLMTDLSISIIRAFLMMLIKRTGSRLFMRSYHNLYSLAITFLVILLYDYHFLSNVSFQLSMMATVGIILFMPLFGIANPAIENDKVESFFTIIKESFLTTLAAQIVTAPIILYHFSELSLLSLISNVALLWLTPIMTLGGVVLYLMAFVFQLFPLLGVLKVFALYIWLVSEIFLKAIAFISTFDLFFLENISFGFIELFLYGVVTFFGYFFLRSKNEKNKKQNHPRYSLKSNLALLGCS